MPDLINQFSGPYRFLSNFYAHPVVLDRVTYPTLEHAYQAAKTDNGADRQIIANMPSPGQAKRFGHHVELRKDWEDVKEQVMRRLIRQKFKDPILRKRLLGTGNATLVEGNYWGDIYWGVCNGQGQNRLGRILMEVRDEIRAEELPRSRR